MLDEIFDFGEGITWVSLGLAFAGAIGSWFYVGYLGTGAGLLTKILTVFLSFIIGYVTAFWILSKWRRRNT